MIRDRFDAILVGFLGIGAVSFPEAIEIAKTYLGEKFDPNSSGNVTSVEAASPICNNGWVRGVDAIINLLMFCTFGGFEILAKRTKYADNPYYKLIMFCVVWFITVLTRIVLLTRLTTVCMLNGHLWLECVLKGFGAGAAYAFMALMPEEPIHPVNKAVYFLLAGLISIFFPNVVDEAGSCAMKWTDRACLHILIYLGSTAIIQILAFGFSLVLNKYRKKKPAGNASPV